MHYHNISIDEFVEARFAFSSPSQVPRGPRRVVPRTSPSGRVFRRLFKVNRNGHVASDTRVSGRAERKRDRRKTSRWNPTPSSWRRRYHLKEFLFLLAPLFFPSPPPPPFCLMFRIEARTCVSCSFSSRHIHMRHARTWWKDRRFWRRMNGTSESRAKEEVLGREIDNWRLRSVRYVNRRFIDGYNHISNMSTVSLIRGSGSLLNRWESLDPSRRLFVRQCSCRVCDSHEAILFVEMRRKRKNNIFSHDASSSRKSSLKTHRVHLEYSWFWTRQRKK